MDPPVTETIGGSRSPVPTPRSQQWMPESQFQAVPDSAPPLFPSKSDKQAVDQLQQRIEGLHLHGDTGHTFREYPAAGSKGEGLFSDPCTTPESSYPRPSYPHSSTPHHPHLTVVERSRVLSYDAHQSYSPSPQAALQATIQSLSEQLYSEKQRNAELQYRLSEPSPPLHQAYRPPYFSTQDQAELQSLRQQLYSERQRNAELQQRLSEPPPPLHQAYPPPQYGNQTELQSLREQVESFRSERDRLRKDNAGLLSQIEVLSHQLAVYKEDFESERSDRENAQGKIENMREEIESLRQTIDELQATCTQPETLLERSGLQPQTWQ